MENVKDYTKIIGMIVSGKIDRPIGSKHPVHDMIYQLNYGYVDGIMANDGEYQDVYIMGVNYPITTFVGKVIAVFQRIDDIEDKWIVSINGENYSKMEILEAINFQEKYFEGILHI